MSDLRSIAAIEVVIGPPEELIADGQQSPTRVRAVWQCGCEATGFRLTHLQLSPCVEHAAQFD